MSFYFLPPFFSILASCPVCQCRHQTSCVDVRNVIHGWAMLCSAQWKRTGMDCVRRVFENCYNSNEDHFYLYSRCLQWDIIDWYIKNYVSLSLNYYIKNYNISMAFFVDIFCIVCKHMTFAPYNSYY